MKVYLYNLCDPMPPYHDKSLIIRICKDWKIVKDINDAEIVMVDNFGISIEWIKQNVKAHQTIVYLDIYHIEENDNPERYLNDLKNITSSKVIVLHQNYKFKPANIENNDNIIWYDHMFDRQKIYCTDYRSEYGLHKCRWTIHCNAEMYKIHPINKNKHKKFLALMRIYQFPKNTPLKPRMLQRQKIKKLLETFDSVLMSTPETGNVFLPNGHNKVEHSYFTTRADGGTWLPVSNKYYDDSYISIYTETMTSDYSETKSCGNGCITEKTFDPMIQGNFVLPFSYPNFIQDCKDIYGFKFPDWIDYSYDTIENDDERLDAYLKCIDKLNQYSIEDLHNFYMQDIDIIEHNRNVFFNKPYEFNSLYDKITKVINTKSLHSSYA